MPRGERDESGGELEIMLMSRRVSPPLWPFQKLLILLVVSGLEIITSSNPCNTAWPAVEPGQFEAGEAGWWGKGGCGETERESKWGRGLSHKLLGPVYCYWVNDVLLTSAVAFYTLNTDLDRYTHIHALKGRSYTSTHMCTHINPWLNTHSIRRGTRHKSHYFRQGFTTLLTSDLTNSQVTIWN